MGAQRTSLAELPLQSDVPVWLPGDTSPPTTGAWLCAANIPALTFDTGAVFFEPAWRGVDVEKKWVALINDYGGYTVPINDHSALVHPSTGPNIKPQVLIVKGDTLVRVLGARGAAVEPLLAIAESLSLDSVAE